MASTPHYDYHLFSGNEKIDVNVINSIIQNIDKNMYESETFSNEEQKRAIDVENKVITDLDAEIKRATTTDKVNASNISAEAQRATAIEEGLRSDVNALVDGTKIAGKATADSKGNNISTYYVPKSTFDSSMATETKRATDAENDLQVKLTKVTNAVSKLNSNEITEGSVAYQIAKIVNENDNGKIDTLKEIANWIVNDTTGAAKMASDISSLQTEVAKKINTSDVSKVGKTGNYSDLKGLPTIPEKVSDLSNDADYASKKYVDNFKLIDNITSIEKDSSIYLSRAGGKNALVDLKLTGGTIVWNQLAPITNSVNNWNRANDASWGSISFVDKTLIYTIGNSKEANRASVYVGSTQRIIGGNTSNHKLLAFLTIKPSKDTYVNLNFWNETDSNSATPRKLISSNVKNKVSYIHSINTRTISSRMLIYFNSKLALSEGDTVEIENVQLFDLTQMFGATIADYVYSLEQLEEGSGMAWLKSYGFFTKDYYEYDLGSLQSVNLAGRKVRSKNLFNYGAWKEVGVSRGTAVFENNGVTITSTESDCYTNYSPAAYPTDAKISVNPGDVITLSWDCDETEQKGIVYVFPNGVVSNFARVFNNESSITYTVPSGVSFLTIRFGVAAAGNTIHYKNIMVRYASDEDATFKPYAPPIFFPFDSSVELRGLFKMDANNELYIDGDSYESDGSVTRKYGIVNLGTLNWNKETDNNVESVFRTPFTSAAPANSNAVASDTIIASKYTVVSSNTIAARTDNIDKAISISESSMIRIVDSSYDNATDFKAAMNGVYLVYKLNTSTVESVSPFTSPQLSFDGCVEEFIDAGSRDVVIPPSIYETHKLNDNIPFVYDIANSASEALHEKIKNESVPINHASTSDIYGLGNANVYGHVSLRNSLTRQSIIAGEALGASQGYKLASMVGFVETNDTIAKKQHNISDQFVNGVNGKLYKVTSPIPQGGNIVINGNCEEAPNLTDQIKSTNIRVDDVDNSLEDLFAMVNGTYEGRDLTRVFASEIANYSDEWTWIQARLNAHNLKGLRVGDYIPINVAANTIDNIPAETHYAEIAGINTHIKSGSSPTINEYHIDWISRDCYSKALPYNTTETNNGTKANPNPFMASELKTWMDGVLYPLLDTKLKNVIKPKNIIAPSRYSESGEILTNDNTRTFIVTDKLWIPFECEITDQCVYSTKGAGSSMALQYPIFKSSSSHRIKYIGQSKIRTKWWTASALQSSSKAFVIVETAGYVNGINSTNDSQCRIPICFRTMEDTN